jgi:hypothetical protein
MKWSLSVFAVVLLGGCTTVGTPEEAIAAGKLECKHQWMDETRLTWTAREDGEVWWVEGSPSNTGVGLQAMIPRDWHAVTGRCHEIMMVYGGG